MTLVCSALPSHNGDTCTNSGGSSDLESGYSNRYGGGKIQVRVLLQVSARAAAAAVSACRGARLPRLKRRAEAREAATAFSPPSRNSSDQLSGAFYLPLRC